MRLLRLCAMKSTPFWTFSSIVGIGPMAPSGAGRNGSEMFWNIEQWRPGGPGERTVPPVIEKAAHSCAANP